MIQANALLASVGFLIILAVNHYVQAGHAQKRLLSKLFKNYSRLERPVQYEYETLSVSLGMTIQQIVDINWKDYNLDILLYNSADDSFDSTSKVNAVVDYTGDVAYIPPGMFRSTCDFKIKDFPFDRQICSLKFGSWTYNDEFLNVTNKSDRGQNGSYIKNPEWILEDILSYSESMSYECCPEKFPYVMFDIHIRRRTLYYEFNLIFPCIFISCLTLLGFMLPPDSGEKIGLEATILLVIITFSHIVSNSIPVSSLSVSRIGLYFKTIIVISSFSILANIIVLIIHHRNVKIDQYMPRWFEIFVYKFLVKLLRMKIPAKIQNYFKIRELKTKHKIKENITFLYDLDEFNDDIFNFRDRNFDANNKPINRNGLNKKSKLRDSTYSFSCHTHMGTADQHHHSFDEEQIKNFSISNSKKDILIIKQSLNSILNGLFVVSRKVEQNTAYEERTLRCKFAAVVIDRLCFVIFLVLLVLSCMFIFTAENFLSDSDPHQKF